MAAEHYLHLISKTGRDWPYKRPNRGSGLALAPGGWSATRTLARYGRSRSPRRQAVTASPGDIETADWRVPRVYVTGGYFVAMKAAPAPPARGCLWRGPGGGWVCCSLLCGCCRAVGPQCRLQPQPSIDPGVTSPRRKPATSETNSANQSWLTANNCNPLSTQAGIRSPSMR